MVRSTASDDTWRRLVLAPLSSPDAAAYTTPLVCDRAYFAANRGVCLVDERSGIVMNHYADIFDEHFSPLHRLTLTGLPSRTRISADGRYAGITVFETGHSYADSGFSTRTTMVDLSSGEVLGDLEQFRILRDGKIFRALDFNFWGVTFTRNSNRFYVTLASAGTNYLVEADLHAREGRIVRTGVECPSLSPDNARIAYKYMSGPPGKWQLHVLDLRSGSDVPLTAETRSVDDQVEWLDDDHVMYHLSGSRGTDIWVLRTDNSEPPRVLRHSSYSPAVVR
jgi:Tol biopolymer transport system component